MGRIEKALRKSRDQRAASAATAANPDVSAVRINEDSEFPPAQEIDISRLRVVVPDQENLEKYRIVAALKDAPERSAYKVLRTRVLQRLRAAQHNVIGVTGSGPGEGKTLTAINFAYSLAQDVNHRVILVDLDLRRPAIHQYLGLSPQHDLADLLEGKADLEEVLICPNANRLAMLLNETAHRESSEILSSPEMVRLINELRGLGEKTITVIDLPPVLASDDVIAFSPLVDTLLLVVAQGHCRREDLRETQELLKDSEILGVVLNQSTEKSAASGYYDYY